MKICILGTAYPYKGGIASFNERLAEELQSIEHEVHITTFTLQYPSLFFPGKTQYSNDTAPDNLDIKRGINSVNPLTWIREGRRLKKEKFDLIIAPFWLPVMGPALGTIVRLAKSENTQAISIIHNIIPHEKRKGDKTFTKYFTKTIDGFLVMSHKVEVDMKSFVKEQVVKYAPHPIYDNYGEILARDKACQHLGLDSSFDYILFFGYIRDYKGLDLLLNSFKKASERNSNLRLIVAGEYYSNEQQYLDLIDQLKIKEQVILRTDFIENDQVKYYFCAADIVAQTYKSATQSGISQLAIHFEKAILSTNVGGLPETTLHKKTGYVVDVNEDVIADTMIKFFEERPSVLFTQEIKKLKLAFSWSNFTKTLLSLRKP